MQIDSTMSDGLGGVSRSKLACGPSPERGNVVHILADPGNASQTLLILHAAGMHGRSYTKLAEHISAECNDSVRILAPDLRAHGDSSTGPETSFTWETVADDITALIMSRGLKGKIIGIGHSLGGASAMIAEMKNPGLFKGLWCYEPVLFSNVEVAAAITKTFGRSKFRRSTFGSYNEAIENFSTKPTFKNLHSQCLRDYVTHGFRHTSRGIELKCHPESEAHVYLEGKRIVGNDKIMRGTACSTVVACGSHVGPENALSREIERLVRLLQKGRGERYGFLLHFGLLEDPAFVAKRIAFFILNESETGLHAPQYLHFACPKL